MKNLVKYVFTGGKGGTGKSTLAILKAKKLLKEGKKVVLCDCDVECPNDNLLLGVDKGKVEEEVFIYFPVLDKKKCRKCGICSQVCQNGAIFQPKGSYPIFIKDLCSGCGACKLACPYGAIKEKQEKVADTYLNKVNDNFYLITGSSRPVLEATGPVVKNAKNFAIQFANKIKADYLILDSAAGTHCPVIAALEGVDKAFVVAEPTVMGAYDLELILKLCKKIKVSHVDIIINQFDLGHKDLINKIAEKYSKKIVEEVSYSRQLAKKYSEGDLLNYEE